MSNPTTEQVLAAIVLTPADDTLTHRAVPVHELADQLCPVLDTTTPMARYLLWAAATDSTVHPASALRVIHTDKNGRITEVLTDTDTEQVVFTAPATAGLPDADVYVTADGHYWNRENGQASRADTITEWVVQARMLADWFDQAAATEQAYNDRQDAAAKTALAEYGTAFDQIRGLLTAAGITLGDPNRNTFYQHVHPRPGAPADQPPATGCVIALRDEQIHQLAAKLAELKITPMAANPEHTDENGLNP